MSTPDELELMTRVARLHYLDGLTRVEIGNQLAISRFKISRLLETAREMGLVTITIGPTGLTDPELSAALMSRFGLRDAHAVVLSSTEPAVLYDRLGKVGANLLSDTATRNDVLGFDSGRTVSHIADHLSDLPPCDVVQLSGLAGAVQQTGLDIVRRVTETSRGAAHPLYAPMIAPDAPSAMALRQQPNIGATMEHYKQVTIAVVSVGSWTPPVSQVYDRLTPDERQDLLAAGVVAETCALMFDQAGRPVPRLDDRRIGIPLDDLHAVPNVIAVAGGLPKVNAILALLTSGLINTLITDAATARALLDRS